MIYEHTHQLFDALSKHTTSVNRLIYANKVDTYDSVEFQEFDQKYMSDLIYHLLKSGYARIDVNEMDKTYEAIEFYEKNICFNFNRYDLIALTPKGGQIWEQEFKPNWYNYIGVHYYDMSYIDPVGIELTSMNYDLLEKYANI